MRDFLKRSKKEQKRDTLEQNPENGKQAKNMDDIISCKHCIHSDVCFSKTYYYAMTEKWNQDNPHILLAPNTEEFLAKHCSNFKTLSDVFLKQSSTLYDPLVDPSRILLRVLNAMDNLGELLSSEPTDETEKEIETLFNDTNDLAKRLSEDEFVYAKKYAAHISGLNEDE